MSWQKAIIWDSPPSHCRNLQAVHDPVHSVPAAAHNACSTCPRATSPGSCAPSDLRLPLHLASPLSFAPGEPLEQARSPPNMIRGKQGWSSAPETLSSLLWVKRNNSSSGTSLAVRSENGQRKTYVQPGYYMVVVPIWMWGKNKAKKKLPLQKRPQELSTMLSFKALGREEEKDRGSTGWEVGGTLRAYSRRRHTWYLGVICTV